jgi:signal transduction histidine kinase
MVINNYKNLLGEEMFSSFMAPDFSKTTILLLTHLSNSSDFLKLKTRILKHVGENPSEDIGWEVTGLGMVIAASSHLLTIGQLKSFSLTVGFIFTLMTVLFLSVKVGLIATLPNIFPILTVFGLMGWLGFRLSMVTSLIASIAIGLAVDDTIHYLVRYNREFKRDLNKDRAMRDTVKGVGRPILLTTVVISLGFSALVFSQFKPTATFGVLMVITMGAALAGDLVLLPALMLHVELVTAWDLLKRMPTLEALSATAAHELRQPLTAIRMGSDFLDMMVQKREAIPREVLANVSREIGTQVDRATDIINRMTYFGRQPGETPEAVDVNRSIRDVLELVSHRLAVENIALELDLAENLPPVSAHSHRLGQVMLNLLANAAEAIQARAKIDGAPRGGTILIRSAEKGGQVAISVEDDGIGIPEHHLDRIMEPFFTTKEAVQGKGLGLSICRQIVKEYNGTMRASSKDRNGAVIEVTLPKGEA